MTKNDQGLFQGWQDGFPLLWEKEKTKTRAIGKEFSSNNSNYSKGRARGGPLEERAMTSTRKYCSPREKLSTV